MIGIVLGTRPEIIKFSPVIRALTDRQIPFYIIHTGQHYNYNLDLVFIEMLELPAPMYHLSVGSGTHAAQTAKMMRAIEEVLLDDKPDLVLVQGDTNTVLAAALVCAKLNDVKIGHVEAGLRSYDRTMPEEINRILTDHISDLLFAPTPNTKRILLGEGINEAKIWVTGNTIVDAVQQNIVIARAKSKILSDLCLAPKSFFLLTLHRQENVVDLARLKGIVEAINSLTEEFRLPVVYPIHPRTQQMIERHGIALARRVIVIDPLGYFDFLALEEEARLILTDSGGVQEEACILGTPCVTLRENTERPETVDIGANCIGGIRYDQIRSSVHKMLAGNSKWPNPLGDGKAGERIAELVVSI